MQEVTCFRIERRKQRELLASLFHHSLVQQHDHRQVGGWPPTSLVKSLTEFLDPLPDRHVRALDADPSEHLLDTAQAYTAAVQQDRQLNELAIRPLTLEKLNLFKHFSQRGKVKLHHPPH